MCVLFTLEKFLGW